MKKMLLVMSLGLAFMGTVGCASNPAEDLDDSSQAAAEAPAPVPDLSAPVADVPQAEPIAQAPAPMPPPPEVADPVAHKSPSLGASSSGRGH